MVWFYWFWRWFRRWFLFPQNSNFGESHSPHTTKTCPPNNNPIPLPIRSFGESGKKQKRKIHTKKIKPINMIKPPRKPKNSQRRPREYLTYAEVGKLIKAAGKAGKHRLRNKTLILLMYRHGLRVSEAVNLKWSQVSLDEATIHVTRLKGGTPSTHPLQGVSIRALRRLRRVHPHSSYVFVSERGAPLTRWTVGKMVAKAGQDAGFDMPIHPHMLRHGFGYHAANKGESPLVMKRALGHKELRSSEIYLQLAPNALQNLWPD